MASPDFTLVLDQAIDRLRSGQSVESCLDAFPAQAEDLLPMLSLTADLVTLPPLEPDPETSARHLAAVLAAFDQQEENRPSGVTLWSWLSGLLIFRHSRPVSSPWPRLVRAAALVMAAVAISGGVVVSAATGSVPGDRLYPVKRSVEQTRLNLAGDSPSRQQLEERFNRERLSEIDTLRTLGRSAEVEFSARIDARERDVWLVGDLPVVISDQTDLEGDLTAGQAVVVHAQVDASGTLTALAIRESGIDSAPVDRTPTPEMTGRPVINPTRRPTRDAAPTAEPTNKPEPTATPRPTREEPTPTRAQDRTATPKPAATREHTPTHRPTDKVEPTATRDDRPAVTAEPKPTDGPPATHVVAPTRDHQPTATPAVNILPTQEPTPPPEPTARPTERPSDKPPTPTPAPPRGDRDGSRHPP